MKKTTYFLVIALAAAMALALSGCSKKEKEKEKLSVEDAISEIVGEYQGEIVSDDFKYVTGDERHLAAFKESVQKSFGRLFNQEITLKVSSVGNKVVEFSNGIFSFNSKEITNLPNSVCISVNNAKAYEDDSDDGKVTLTLFPLVNPDAKDQSGQTYSVYYSKKDKQISVTLTAEMDFIFTKGKLFVGTFFCRMRMRGTKK